MNLEYVVESCKKEYERYNEYQQTKSNLKNVRTSENKYEKIQIRFKILF